MPYTKKKDRYKIPTNAGQLNQVLSSICAQYIVDKEEKYAHYNDVLAVINKVNQMLPDLSSVTSKVQYRAPVQAQPSNVGELYDKFYAIVRNYIENNNILDVYGVLNAMNLEFYRRLVAWYEDIARFRNGDLREIEEILKRRRK
jgi:hypothetical protein